MTPTYPRKLYFLGQGHEATALITRGLSLLNEHLRKCNAFQREHGADYLSKHAHGGVHALVYERDEGSSKAATGKGMQHIGVERRDGVTLDLYGPDRHTTAGLALAAHVAAIGKFNLSDWLVHQLGALREAKPPGPPPASGARFVSSAGTRAGVLFLEVPEVEADPFVPPPWLKPALRAEYFAAMGVEG